MSKLLQRLKSTSESAAPAMGFRAAAFAARPKGPALVALLAKPDVKAAKAAVEAGADAVCIQSEDPAMVKDIAEAAGTVACGAMLSAPEADVAAIRKAGCDFVIVAPGSAPASWLRADLTRVGRVPASTDLMSLGGIDRVGIDAVLLDRAEADTFISISYVMTCAALSGSLSRPLLTAVAPSVSQEEIAALWDAGVDGFLVQATASKLSDMHKTLWSLPPRTRKRTGKDLAVLPRLSEATSAQDDDEGDDE